MVTITGVWIVLDWPILVKMDYNTVRTGNYTGKELLRRDYLHSLVIV